MSCNYNKVLIDFDNTIWSDKDIKNSINNLKILLKLIPKYSIEIISGNTFDSIKSKIQSNVCNITEFNIPIWANVNSCKFLCGLPVNYISDFIIDEEDCDVISNYLLDKFNIECQKIVLDDNIFNLKIKPLSNLERDLLINNLQLSNILGNCKASKTGFTTVDIVSKNNDKKVLFDKLNYSRYNTLYVGDEIDFGNDSNIATCCTDFIKVKSVKDTNKLLNKLLSEN